MSNRSFVIECIVLCLLIATISVVAYTRTGDEEAIKPRMEGASILIQERAEVVRGGAAKVPVTLETGTGTPSEVRYTLCLVNGVEEKDQCPMPDGLLVGIDPVIFRAEPETTYQAELNLSACSDCSPGAYVLMLDAGVATQWIEVMVV